MSDADRLNTYKRLEKVRRTLEQVPHLRIDFRTKESIVITVYIILLAEEQRLVNEIEQTKIADAAEASSST